MLLLLGSWLVLIAVCFSVGTALLNRLGASAFERAGDRFVAAVWLGMVVLANLLLALSLLLPLSPVVGAIVMGGLTLLALLDARGRSADRAFSKMVSPQILLCAIFLCAGVAFFMTRPVTYYDTGLYHFSVIKWLNRFGTVRGLALIQDRFGVPSAWYALAAPFNAEMMETRAAVLADGFALLMALFHLVIAAARCLAGRGRSSDLLVVAASMVLIPVAVIFWIMPVSAAPDFPAIVLTVVVAWTIALIISGRARPAEKRVAAATDDAMVALVLATGALTIKLSALPVAVVAALFYLSRGAQRWRRLVTVLFTGLVLVAPLIAYSTVTSGCLLFPVASSCMDVPWAVGAQAARKISEQILIWGRWGGPAPAWANSWNWLGPWLMAGVTRRNGLLGLFPAALLACGLALLRLLGWRRAGQLLILAGGAGLALFLMLRAQGLLTVCATILGLATMARPFKERNWLLATGLSGIALSVISAPDLRFGLGYVSVLLACFVVAYREELRSALAPQEELGGLGPGVSQQAALAALLVCSGLAMIAARLGVRQQLPPTSVAAGVTFNEAASLHLLTPPMLPVAPLRRRRLNDIDYYQPEQDGAQCWGAELPCAWESMPEDLVLSDPARGIAAGFVHRGRAAP